MRLRLLLSALLLTVCTAPAAYADFQPDLSALDELPMHAAAADVVAKSIDRSRQHKGGGLALFAATARLPLSFADGVWDQPSAGTSRWRTRVYSAGARALMMEFGRYAMPAGARLWIYDAGGQSVQGPYSDENNSARGRLWTAMVPGDTAVIELQVPSALRSAAVLELSRIAHAYRDPRDVSDIGSSTACEINVACPLGNEWRDQIRSVVKLQIPDGDSVGVCSGSLVNNLAEDAKPYVLTAHHCEIRAANQADIVVYFNFQNSSCGGAANAQDTQNITGTTVVALNQAVDMTLLRLSKKPPAAYNAFYAGFDASGDPVSSGVGIHHPSGDVKKIAEFTTAPELGPANVDGYENVPAYIVTWSQGVTEPGSSGSALWNQDQLIVGTLSGGASACADPSLTDSYARVDKQWLGNGNAGGQLKAWLDPASTGTKRLLGKNASALASPTPTATPTASPTAQPTASPTAQPTASPTAQPTATPVPTATPTATPDPDDDDEGGGGGGASSPLALALLGMAALLRRRRPSA